MSNAGHLREPPRRGITDPALLVVRSGARPCRRGVPGHSRAGSRATRDAVSQAIRDGWVPSHRDAGSQVIREAMVRVLMAWVLMARVPGSQVIRGAMVRVLMARMLMAWGLICESVGGAAFPPGRTEISTRAEPFRRAGLLGGSGGLVPMGGVCPAVCNLGRCSGGCGGWPLECAGDRVGESTPVRGATEVPGGLWYFYHSRSVCRYEGAESYR
jgi:hypothetical protein